MQINIETRGTAGEILDAMELCMKLNSRKQNFQALAEKGGRGLIVAPESEYIETGRPKDWQGLALILRYRWNQVPGYRERVAGELAGIMGKCL